MSAIPQDKDKTVLSLSRETGCRKVEPLERRVRHSDGLEYF